MRIAYLAFSPQFVAFIEGLIKGLLARGHDVQIFTTHHLPVDADNSYLLHAPVIYRAWSWFELDEFVAYDPDVTLIWNGYAPWTYAAMEWVKDRYKVLHVERAWLPQKNNCYIASDLAAHSPFIMDVPEDFPVDVEAVAKLREFYGSAARDPGLPEKFVFMPGQLDHDTSITISSPRYKTCDSLLGDLLRQMPGVPVVIRNHPLMEVKERPPGAIIYHWGELPLGSVDLMAQATAVAGITSTMLAEALIYNKPIASFGMNVGMRSHIQSIPELLHAYNHPDEYLPKHSHEQTLSWLLSKQWDGRDVPQWVFEYIEENGR